VGCRRTKATEALALSPVEVGDKGLKAMPMLLTWSLPLIR
jgi:hypothetical protein